MPVPKIVPLVASVEHVPASGETCQANAYDAYRFGACSSPAKYHASDMDKWFCGRHYRAVYRAEIDWLPNEVGLPPFVPTGAASYWKLSNDEDMVDSYLKAYRQQAATILRVMPELPIPLLGHIPDEVLAEREAAFHNPDTPAYVKTQMQSLDVHNGPNVLIDGIMYQNYPNSSPRSTRSFFGPYHTGFRKGDDLTTSYRASSMCALCGHQSYGVNHGSMVRFTDGRNYNLGYWHYDCREWFTLHARDWGLQMFPCGHGAVASPEADPVDLGTKTYTCVDCNGDYLPLDKSVGTGCPVCNVQNRTTAWLSDRIGGPVVRCWDCAAHMASSEEYRNIHARVAKLGVVGDRNLNRTIADTYVLMELSFYSEKAEAALEKHIAQLSKEFLAYSIAACGGELRYAYSSRDNSRKEGLSAKMSKLLGDEVIEDLQAVYCTGCHRLGDYCVKNFMKAHKTGLYWRKIEQIYGAVNSPPVPKDQAVVYMQGVSEITFNGVHYKVYSPPAELDKEIKMSIAGSSGRKDRFTAWEGWMELVEADPLKYMEACANMFNTGYWAGGGVGGTLWGTGASLAVQFLRGDISALHFVDLVFGLQHNGGPFLNKTYPIGCGTVSITQLLDYKRMYDSSSRLLSYATPWVLDLYMEIYMEGVSELEVGAIAISKHRHVNGKHRHGEFLATIREEERRWESKLSSAQNATALEMLVTTSVA